MANFFLLLGLVAGGAAWATKMDMDMTYLKNATASQQELHDRQQAVISALTVKLAEAEWAVRNHENRLVWLEKKP